MAILILAPVFEEVENRVELIFGMLLQMAINGDVAPVTNLLGQVGRVENKLRLEEGVASALRQEGQVKVRHCLVQEACVTGFIARHQGESFGQEGIAVFEFTGQLFIEEEARKLCRAGTL